MGNWQMMIRTAEVSDIEGLEALDIHIYSENGAADPGCIARRVHTFREGVLVGVERDKIRAAIYLRPLQDPVRPGSPLTWKEAENNGDFTPPPDFRFMYGVGYVGTGGTSDLMLLAGIRQCVKLGIQAGFFGSRIPTLTTEFPSTKPSINEVRRYVDSGKDWEIRMYLKARPLGLDIVRTEDGQPVVIDNYFDDPESRNFGVLWVWKNTWLGWKKWFGLTYFSCLICIERFFAK